MNITRSITYISGTYIQIGSIEAYIHERSLYRSQMYFMDHETDMCYLTDVAKEYVLKNFIIGTYTIYDYLNTEGIHYEPCTLLGFMENRIPHDPSTVNIVRLYVDGLDFEFMYAKTFGNVDCSAVHHNGHCLYLSVEWSIKNRSEILHGFPEFSTDDVFNRSLMGFNDAVLRRCFNFMKYVVLNLDLHLINPEFQKMVDADYV